ncbi:MAG: aminoacyl-tRNA hydrolase [Saprospiraceae bacterium]|nr:aminoacyl-tRNA hydrolase [Saprospiraceae bacterium]
MREGIIIIGSNISIPVSEVRIKTMRSGGPGGQHVNKVETAVQLQFDIINSSIPTEIKDKIMSGADKRINKEGVFILKCDEYRSQKKNREGAIERLVAFIRPYTRRKRLRIKSKPTKGSLERKKKQKINRSRIKSLRRKPSSE